ncbi:MAG: sensor signal transduction histidine kinase, partial [Polaromonas sp.]|nr:sensor signal transduction histidine kinase [Polaromonas sp.]
HLEALNSQLEGRVVKRTEQLQASVRELEAFSHAVAHDLRGPLSTIANLCRLLGHPVAGSLNDKGHHYLQRVKSNVQQMAELTDALLSLANLSQIDLRHEQVDLTALAQEAFDDCRARDPERTVRSAVQAGMQCMGDARLLRQVLVNLIGNAWKFSAKQLDAAIEVGMTPGSQTQAVFFVRDNGAGFDMAHADKLFATFERLHSPSEFEGTGIGLATVRRIIVRHEGRVWAEAAPEEGASFFFTLWETARSEQARDNEVAPESCSS